jgi:hypothetical protein
MGWPLASTSRKQNSKGAMQMSYNDFVKSQRTYTLDEALKSTDACVKEYAIDCEPELVAKLHVFGGSFIIEESPNGRFAFMIMGCYEAHDKASLSDILPIAHNWYEEETQS